MKAQESAIPENLMEPTKTPSRRERRRTASINGETALTKANIFLSSGDIQEAKKCFDDLLKNTKVGSKEHFSALWGLGRVKEQEGDIDTAVSLYKQALMEHPDHARESHYLHAVAMLEQSTIATNDQDKAAILQNGLASLEDKIGNQSCTDCKVGDRMLEKHATLETGSDNSTRSKFFKLLKLKPVNSVNRTAANVTKIEMK